MTGDVRTSKEDPIAGIAHVHDATISPTKIELARTWLPKQVWFTGDPAQVEMMDRFRFEDPDGEVGVETFLLQVGNDIYQLPVTFRAAPLEGAEEGLIGTTEHTVLGTRYVYDGMFDPVYLAELDRTIREADTAASVAKPDGTIRPPTVNVRGSGVSSTTHVEGELEVVSLITDEQYAEAPGHLIATLGEAENAYDVVLAILR